METFTSFLSNGAGSILGFLVALVPLIALHEIGHMLMAKKLGVWVREFGLGYPPRIKKLFQWQETEFTLNWLPIGGFARMEGEGFFDEIPDTAAESQDMSAERAEARRHSLYTATPGKRILIYAAGPAMNLITAWVLAVVLFLTGIPTPKEMRVQLSEIMPNSPAAAAGLQAGDTVLALNGQAIAQLEQISEIVQENLGKSVSVTVERAEEELTLSVVPRINPPKGEGAMGVMLQAEVLSTEIQRFSLTQALSKATLAITNLCVQMVTLPVSLMRGLISLQEARPVGVVGIARIAYASIQESFVEKTLFPILNLLIIVSASLGIFNLLPIPALDGGRIVITALEKIQRRALSPIVQERIFQATLMILLVLFVVITFYDIISPVPIP